MCRQRTEEKGPSMRTFTVYTENGTYTGIRAVSAEHAKKIVWKQTLGRERVDTMTAMPQ